MTTVPFRFTAAGTYFLIAAILYLYGSAFLDAQALAYLSMVSISIGVLISLFKGDRRYASSNTVIIAAMAFVALINVLTSTDPFESTLRWGLWVAMIIGMNLLSTRFEKEVDVSLATTIPWVALVIWYAKYWSSGSDGIDLKEKVAALHLSAFFASLCLSTGLLHPKKHMRLIFVAVGVYGIIVSGSRAALLFLPLQFIAASLYYFRNKLTSFVVLLIPLAALIFVLFDDELRDATLGQKAVIKNRDTVLDARRALEDRGYLRDLAYDMIGARPQGYGYGNTYKIPGATKDRGTNFHNGFLNIGAMMGVHVMLAYLIFLLWLFRELAFKANVSPLFRYLFLAILISCMLRSITEDFTPFDLGNPIAYLLVYLTLLYLNKRRFMPGARAI
jgi:hypothetical protein